MTSRFEVLVKYQADLESSLQDADLLELSSDLHDNIVLPKEVQDKFSSLDPSPKHLKQEVKVRYLLKHVYGRVREDENVYDRLIKVLSRQGGEVKALCGAMGREVDKATDSRASGGSVEDTQLVEQDVPYLVEILVSGSHLWDAIGIALNLPKQKREDCSEGKENVNRLSNILTTWILSSYEGARPATLGSLREALASETVGLEKLAQELMVYKELLDPLPNTKKVKPNLKIIFISGYIEVTDEKSTLLEVQVNCLENVSYQWSKDGEPLPDGAYFSGVCSNILYINRASQCTEGKYSCCVSRGSETVYSDEMSLSVIYPPEKKQLLDFYSIIEREEPRAFWPPIGSSAFFNLFLIKEKPMRTCACCTIGKNLDDILESKEVAEYKEAFREYREGALVLVEGRSGCGKTTLVHKLTRDWASGKEILQGAKLVFLVTLRLLDISGKDKSLLDLLQIYFYDKEFSKQIEHTLMKCQGKGACFILDGLDEYPIESKKNLVIDQLLFTKTFLPHSMVIVASHPVAEEELMNTNKTRLELELVGFSKDQIYSYVRSYPFSNCSVDMAHKMTEFLDQHPNVLHMCYLPIHAAMLCFLFNTLKGDTPHRETQIYEQFTLATLLKHKARKGGELQLRSLEDLGNEDIKSLKSVCKLAFDMMINSQLVISKSNAQVYSIMDSALELIKVERTSKYFCSEDFYSFIHLTFQEFLAAIYIHKAVVAKGDEEELIKGIRFRNIGKFYSGLSKSSADIIIIKKIFTEFIFNLSDKVQCAYESQQVELCDYIIEDEMVIVSEDITFTDFIALGYVISRTTKLLNTIVWHPCCNSEGVKLLVSMATDKKLQFIKCLVVKRGNDEDFKTLNYLLLHLPFLEQLDLLGLHLNKSRIEYLTKEVTLPHLKVLKLCLPLVPTCLHPERVLQQLTFNSKSMSQVIYLVRYGHEVNHVAWNKILHYVFGCQTSPMSWLHLYNIDNYPSLPHERLSYCTEVVLVNCCIGDEGAEILANTLNTSVLENLVLDFNRIGDSGIVALASCLARCNVVKEVSIECNCIGDSGATALADALVHCSSLRRLDLQGNSLGDKGAVAIAKATESLPRLDLYLHNVNISEEGVERVLKYRARTRIRSMEFTSSWDRVSSEGSIDTLKRALYCGYLPALKLSSSNISVVEKLVTEQECVTNVSGIECEEKFISDDTVPTLCCIINHLPSLTLIIMKWDNDSSFNSPQCLSDCLKTCKSLHSLTLRGRDIFVIPNSLIDVVRCSSQLSTLSLSWVDISSYGVDLLLSNHKFWINLHTLNLVCCRLSSDYAQVLSTILIHCKKLYCLDLSGNRFGDRGALAIAEGLKNHTSLLELKMDNNFITSEGMTALCQVIKCNHIQHLNLGFNDIADCVPILVNVMCHDNLQILELESIELGVDSIAILRDGLKKCTQLVKLDFSYNDIVQDGVVCLAEGLQYCTNLQELDLRSCYITSDGVTALCGVMSSCKYLRRLNLVDNSIGVDGVATLIEGWQHKSLLTLGIIGMYMCIGYPHMSAIMNGEKCCSSCDRLLELYYMNDYVYITDIPKVVSID